MKRPRGFRTITVGAQAMFWQVRTESSEVVVVAGGRRLVVRLHGWRDPWLSISDVHVRDGVMTFESSARNEPAIVGPGFVRRAIDFALANGWSPVERGPDLKVVFIADSFEMSR